VKLSQKQFELLKLLEQGFTVQIPNFTCIKEIRRPVGGTSKDYYRLFTRTSVYSLIDQKLISKTAEPYDWYVIGPLGREFLAANPTYPTPPKGVRLRLKEEIGVLEKLFNSLELADTTRVELTAKFDSVKALLARI
jgi:hypothetical protein